MSYNPIILKEDVRQRPRQVPTHVDFNKLANDLIAQVNNVTLEVSELFTKVEACQNSLSDLQVILQRQLDGVIAGVMPENSVGYAKFVDTLKTQLDLVNTQVSVLNTLSGKLTNVVNQYNTARNINNADITVLKGV